MKPLKIGELKEAGIKLRWPLNVSFYIDGQSVNGKLETGYRFKSHDLSGGQDYYYGITQRFGQNLADFYKPMLGHNGADYLCPIGTPIYAEIDGSVTFYPDQDKGGNVIKLVGEPFKIDDQTVRIYILLAHLSEFIVKSGKVRKGDKIALSGNTGKWTTGAHLHEGFMIEYLENGQWVRDTKNGYDGALDQWELLEKPEMPTQAPDYSFLNSLKSKNRKCLIFRPEANGECYYITSNNTLQYLEGKKCALFDHIIRAGIITPISELDFNKIKMLIV